MNKTNIALLSIYFALVIIVTFAGFKKKKRKKAFLINLFLTPIAGVILYLKTKEKTYNLNNSTYIVSRYKCENCGYKFDENYDFCPICEKEGEQIELQEVKQFMT